jgi:hypothetical protein
MPHREINCFRYLLLQRMNEPSFKNICPANASIQIHI